MAGQTPSLRSLAGGLGRQAAAAVLAAFLLLQLAAPALLSGPRQALFDAYQAWAPRQRDPHMAPVVIVAVDNDSLRAEGPWPWPHERLADLADVILAERPAALGLDMFLSASDRRAAAAAAGAGRGDPDQALAAALARGPVVVGVQGVTGPDCGAGGGDGGPFAPVVMSGGPASLARLPCFATTNRSAAPVDLAAAGHGVISNDWDRDGVFRRLQMISVINGQVAPGLALDIYRLVAGSPLLTLYGGPGAARGVGVGATVFPFDADGSVGINFTRRDDWSVCSAEGLLRARTCIDPSTHRPIPLAGRVVLLGITADGMADQQRKTPVGAMPGVEIQAQGLENLFAGAFVRRPAWARALEAGLTLVLGLFLIGALPATRGPWRTAASLAPLVLLAVVGLVLWWRFRWLVDVASPAIACVMVFVALLGGGLAEVDAQRRRLRREVEIGRLAAARAEGELEAGRRIQMGILPNPEALTPDPRFDLDAVMVPARQIGGDLYDFFKIDKDHLFIAVGDVSGKGLPASLFMALGKSLCKSCALRGQSDIGAIVRTANAEISRDNPEMLFITLFAGVLDLNTGELAFCNAGHDPPFLIRAGEAVRAVPAEGGPPLCVVDDFPYEAETVRLAPGDVLCVTTDGVSEAMTASGDLMGRAAVDRALGALPAGTDAHQTTAALQAAVAGFVAGADPSDDLTILTLRWRGP